MSFLDRHIKIKLYEQKLSEKNVKEEVLVSKASSKSIFKNGQKVSYKADIYEVKYFGDGNCVIEKDNKQQFVPCDDLKLVKDNMLDENKVNESAVIGNGAKEAIKKFLSVSTQLAESKTTLGDLNKMINSLTELKESIQTKEDFLTEEEEAKEEIPEVPQEENDMGIYGMLNSLIADELQAIDGYNSAVQTIRSLGTVEHAEELISILTDIAGEEHIHVGQLQRATKLVNPQAELVQAGEKEAEEVIEGEKDEVQNS